MFKPGIASNESLVPTGVKSRHKDTEPQPYPELYSAFSECSAFQYGRETAPQRPRVRTVHIQGPDFPPSIGIVLDLPFRR